MQDLIADDRFEPLSRTYVSQGLDLHYVDWGNEGAPLIILVHGIRDHARSWDQTARALRHRWHVVAMDLRGHGDSQWSPDGAYLLPYHMLDFYALIDALDEQSGGQAPFALVGHSFGGNVVSRAAALFADRVSRLVIVDGLGPSPKIQAEWKALGVVRRTRSWIDQRRDPKAIGQRSLPTIEQAAARMAAANTRLSADQARHLALHGTRPDANGYRWKFDPRVSMFTPEDFALEMAEFWCAVAASTLICHGTNSWTSNPETDGRAAHFSDHRTIVFEEAGHWLHHDSFDAFIAVLLDFF